MCMGECIIVSHSIGVMVILILYDLSLLLLLVFSYKLFLVKCGFSFVDMRMFI